MAVDGLPCEISSENVHSIGRECDDRSTKSLGGGGDVLADYRGGLGLVSEDSLERVSGVV